MHLQVSLQCLCHYHHQFPSKPYHGLFRSPLPCLSPSPFNPLPSLPLRSLSLSLSLSFCKIQADLKKNHAALVSQLITQLAGSLGPQLRRALGQAFVALYTSGETFSLHTTVGKCCDIIRTKEDQSNTSNKLWVWQCAVVIIIISHQWVSPCIGCEIITNQLHEEYDWLSKLSMHMTCMQYMMLMLIHLYISALQKGYSSTVLIQILIQCNIYLHINWGMFNFVPKPSHVLCTCKTWEGLG